MRATSSVVTASILATRCLDLRHLAESQELAGDLVGAAGGAFEIHDEARLELRLGAGDLGFGDAA